MPVGDKNSPAFQYADKKTAKYAAMANALAFIAPELKAATDFLVRGEPTGEYKGRVIKLSMIRNDVSISDGERSNDL